ncbi:MULTISPECIES: RNA polymerase sigma factor [Gordonia]|uniref:RNA polymerase subunit sigma-24 n=2 Tax=Gordonia alkanivorans TaxID=84096 RepID=W9DLF1_9ACTN|nr:MULTISPECIES: DUF6596 domain-containing protein [Gordonia]AZZ81839.1 RNA polymerase subunit sigma-24 [Gordonia alkanivorans]ETA07990.1 RNA polymerase subunit sigma-24 [Gordonia alkanivorans CGMCC 6845]MDH3006234.1 sigma factor [Gordonia alkanivorans]MDH3009559.1 sigma factor [Gordonia alkanivorans]MDH3013991.1 sigma factor [Gordonia alkanivorans]
MTGTPDRSAGAPLVARRAVATIDRGIRTRVIATLTRRFGDLDRAEDALQDALAQALVTWPQTGVPESPEAWLTTTAKRRVLDELRRENVLAGKLGQLQTDSDRAPVPADFGDPADITHPALPDERLGMYFACTHPVLRIEDRIALMLRFVAGLTTPEVAHALLIPVPTAQQRLVRAKKRIKALGVPFHPPRADDLPDRLGGVLRVVYLVYSEGYARSTGSSHIRDDITAEAIALARTLYVLLPCAETAGLLALLLLTESRRPARVDPDGRPIPLSDQDRTLWVTAMVREGTALAESAAAQRDAGAYTIQAAIAAVHAEARTADDTDWAQIAVLYRLLEAHDPGPVVRIGRAVSVGRAFGPSRGIEMLNRLASNPSLDRYRPFHVARALTLAELDDHDGAAAAYRRALELPGNEAEDDYLASILAGLTQDS